MSTTFSITDEAYLLRVKVLGTIGVLFEKLSSSVTQKFVIGNLQFECATVPFIVEVDIIGMDECQFLIYTSVSSYDPGWVGVRRTRCFGSQDVLAMINCKFAAFESNPNVYLQPMKRS